MLRRLMRVLRGASVVRECNISDIEKDGKKAFDCARCQGSRAKIMKHTDGGISAECAACGCSLFSVQEAK